MKELINGLKKWRNMSAFEATEVFNNNYNTEVDWALKKAKVLQQSDEEKVYLKMAIVLAVTHLAVFVENLSREFIDNLFDEVKYVDLSTDLKRTHTEMLSSELSKVCKDIPQSIKSDKKETILKQLDKIKVEINNYYNEEVARADFKFKSQLTLGQRRKEIISIFEQFDKEFSRYLNEKEEEFELRIDEALLVRHAVVHQNKMCTYSDIAKHCKNIRKFVIYADEIMNSILQKMIKKI